MSLIREIRESDASDFLALCRQLDVESRFMLLEPGERKTTPDEQEKRIRDILSRDNQTIFVAEEQGSLVGHLAAIGGSYARNKGEDIGPLARILTKGSFRDDAI